jgi:hypothetical protein
MQTKIAHTRLEINRIRSRHPDRWTVARLTPHTQRRESANRIVEPKLIEDGPQQLNRPLYLSKVGTHEPVAQASVP